MKTIERSDDFSPVQAARLDGFGRTEEQGLEGMRALRKSIRKIRMCLRERGEISTSVLIPICTAFLVVRWPKLFLRTLRA